ncbi:MAG: hypothetical protein J6V79_02470 [Bacilli bacterium]|nr:hypothetical protein [Bacilli bacterium]
MEETVQQEEKVASSKPKKQRIVLFVLATIVLAVCVYCILFIWSINFQEIVQTVKDGNPADEMAAILAVLMLSIPFLAAGGINVLLALIFGPLCLAKLRKSSIKVFSILGILYGLALFGTAIASVARIVMYIMGAM